MNVKISTSICTCSIYIRRIHSFNYCTVILVHACSLHSLSFFLLNIRFFGSSENDEFLLVPVFPFRLIVVCPNITEFCVVCVRRYVGFSF